MKEIDFDELDRAVNSLMKNVGGSGSAKQPDEAAAATSPTAGETANAATQSSVPAPEPAAPALSSPVADLKGETTTTPTPVTPTADVTTPAPEVTDDPASAIKSSSSVASRRGGRFMDVVHPSSDMKTAQMASNQPVSRQGVTIEPLATATTAEANGSVPAEAAAPAPESTTAISTAGDWPDPLELSEQSNQTPTADQPATSAPTSEPTEAVATSTPETEPAPLSSPFLSDAKVEKRPLGGLNSSDQSTESEGIDDKTDQQDDPQTTAKPEAVEQPLPPELQGDLVAIEAGGSPTDESPEQPTSVESSPAGAKPTDTPESETKKQSTTPSLSTSIPQQYKEAPSTGEQQNGAIYDTDSYHQPLAHPAKKKSGWLIVLWIVIVLLLGAGGGAAVYFLGLV